MMTSPQPEGQITRRRHFDFCVCVECVCDSVCVCVCVCVCRRCVTETMHKCPRGITTLGSRRHGHGMLLYRYSNWNY
jgi:hypothetical protein